MRRSGETSCDGGVTTVLTLLVGVLGGRLEMGEKAIKYCQYHHENGNVHNIEPMHGNCLNDQGFVPQHAQKSFHDIQSNPKIVPWWGRQVNQGSCWLTPICNGNFRVFSVD